MIICFKREYSLINELVRYIFSDYLHFENIIFLNAKPDL
jgi:hypothetical protein